MDKSILTILSKKGYRPKPTGTLYKMNCPFHNDPKPSFTIYPHTNSFYCFGCGKGGSVIQLLKLFGDPIPLTMFTPSPKPPDKLLDKLKTKSVSLEERVKRIILNIKQKRQFYTDNSILNKRVMRVLNAYRRYKQHENTTHGRHTYKNKPR